MNRMILICMGLILPVLLLAQSPAAFNYQAVVRDATGTIKDNQNVSFRISILQGSTDGTVVFQETHSAMTNEFGLVNLVIGSGTNLVGTISSIDWGSNSYFLKVEIDPSGGSSYIPMGITQLLSVPYALYSRSSGGSFWSQSGSNIYFNNGNVGVGFNSPLSKLHVYNLEGFRQIAANEWADMSSCGAGVGLFATNAYLNNTNNSINYSLTHDQIGAAGIIFNSPAWNTASIFVNKPSGGSVKDQSFDPDFIATFQPGEINVNASKITNVANPVHDQDAATKAYVDVLTERIEQLESFFGVSGLVKDGSENVYKAIKIGSQIWMSGNLRTTHYNDGTPIPFVTDAVEWMFLRTPGYCWYNNDESNKNTFGGLYNWPAVETGKLCPMGWHVPSEEEWKVLEMFLGMMKENYSNFTFSGSVGKKLKSATGWIQDGNGDGSSGFNAPPGGTRNWSIGRDFADGGSASGFWLSANFEIKMLYWDNENCLDRLGSFNYGLSIRCLKD